MPRATKGGGTLSTDEDYFLAASRVVPDCQGPIDEWFRTHEAGIETARVWMRMRREGTTRAPMPALIARLRDQHGFKWRSREAVSASMKRVFPDEFPHGAK